LGCKARTRTVGINPEKEIGKPSPRLQPGFGYHDGKSILEQNGDATPSPSKSDCKSQKMRKAFEQATAVPFKASEGMNPP